MRPVKSYINDNIEDCIHKVYNQVDVLKKQKIEDIDTLRSAGKFGHYRNDKFPLDIRQYLYKKIKTILKEKESAKL